MKTRNFSHYKTASRTGLFCLVFLFSLTACRKDIEVTKSDPSQGNLKSMTELKVASDFSWKTFQDVQVELSATTKTVVFLKSSSGAVYEKAIVLPKQTYNTIIAVPTYETELTISCNGQPHTVKIFDKKISYSF